MKNSENPWNESTQEFWTFHTRASRWQGTHASELEPQTLLPIKWSLFLFRSVFCSFRIPKCKILLPWNTGLLLTGAFACRMDILAQRRCGGGSPAEGRGSFDAEHCELRCLIHSPGVMSTNRWWAFSSRCPLHLLLTVVISHLVQVGG